MKTKLHLQKEDVLLAARRQTLDMASRLNLRPLGKIWGMDAFTWGKPNLEELHATIQHFPFSVYWFATLNQVKEYFERFDNPAQNIEWLAQYDGTSPVISPLDIRQIPLYTSTENIEDAILFLTKNQNEKHVLLYTFEGSDWISNLEFVENFVKENSTY